MTLTKTMAALTVVWHDRSNIVQKASGHIKNAWDRLLDKASQIQALALILLSIMTVCVIGARVQWAQQTETAEAMRLDLEKQEAIRASMVAAEQAKANEVAAAARAEREAVARVLYGTALHHSEDAQRAVVWCILNRVESSLYPNTITEVCEQPSQWMGYSPENPVIESLYSIADEVITGWESGGYRAISPDYLSLTWERDAIVLRTTFTEGPGTHYWRCG